MLLSALSHCFHNIFLGKKEAIHTDQVITLQLNPLFTPPLFIYNELGQIGRISPQYVILDGGGIKTGDAGLK